MAIKHEYDKEIVRLYVEERWTIKEIGRHLHWSDNYVRSRLIANDIPRRTHKVGGRRVDSRRVTLAVMLRTKQNMAVTDIARIMNTSHSVVIRYLKKAGVYKPLYQSLTHCTHGHELTPANTYEWRGHRQCKACKRRRNRETMARARERRKETT